jgi:hypothetical protein
MPGRHLCGIGFAGATHTGAVACAASLYDPLAAAPLQRVAHVHALLGSGLGLKGHLRNGFVTLELDVLNLYIQEVEVEPRPSLFQVF